MVPLSCFTGNGTLQEGNAVNFGWWFNTGSIENHCTDIMVLYKLVAAGPGMFGTREAFQAFELTEWTPVVNRYLQVRREQMNGELTEGITPAILWEGSSITGWSLEDAHADLLRNGGFDPQAEQRAIWMWTIGSMNQSFRSIALDGESLVTVTGHSALVSAIDFIFIMAIAEWPDTQADFDRWFPPRDGGLRLPHYELIRSLF